MKINIPCENGDTYKNENEDRLLKQAQKAGINDFFIISLKTKYFTANFYIKRLKILLTSESKQIYIKIFGTQGNVLFITPAAELCLELESAEDYDYLKKTGVFTVEGINDIEDYSATRVIYRNDRI